MPRTPDYLSIVAGCDVSFELEVKRSRFIGVLRRTPDEPAARELLAELRRAHHSARHHCSAFVIGPSRDLQRTNDDGEPSGTAGTPMLQALLGHSLSSSAAVAPLSDVAAVVVRYFGGTLLGAGGLVRAYSAAVSGALAEARFVRRERRTLRRLTLPHDQAGRVTHDLHAIGVVVQATDYAVDGLRLSVAVPGGAGGDQRFRAWLAERRILAEDAGTEWIDVPLARSAT